MRQKGGVSMGEVSCAIWPLECRILSQSNWLLANVGETSHQTDGGRHWESFYGCLGGLAGTYASDLNKLLKMYGLSTLLF